MGPLEDSRTTQDEEEGNERRKLEVISGMGRQGKGKWA